GRVKVSQNNDRPTSKTSCPAILTSMVAPRSPTSSAGDSFATDLTIHPVWRFGTLRRSASWSVRCRPSVPDQNDFLSSSAAHAVEDASVIGQNPRWRRGGLRRALYGQCQCSRVNDESSTMRAATIAGRRGKPIFSY